MRVRLRVRVKVRVKVRVRDSSCRPDVGREMPLPNHRRIGGPPMRRDHGSREKPIAIIDHHRPCAVRPARMNNYEYGNSTSKVAEGSTYCVYPVRVRVTAVDALV